MTLPQLPHHTSLHFSNAREAALVHLFSQPRGEVLKSPLGPALPHLLLEIGEVLQFPSNNPQRITGARQERGHGLGDASEGRLGLLRQPCERLLLSLRFLDELLYSRFKYRLL